VSPLQDMAETAGVNNGGGESSSGGQRRSKSSRCKDNDGILSVLRVHLTF